MVTILCHRVLHINLYHLEWGYHTKLEWSLYCEKLKKRTFMNPMPSIIARHMFSQSTYSVSIGCLKEPNASKKFQKENLHILPLCLPEWRDTGRASIPTADVPPPSASIESKFQVNQCHAKISAFSDNRNKRSSCSRDLQKMGTTIIGLFKPKN